MSKMTRKKFRALLVKRGACKPGLEDFDNASDEDVAPLLDWTSENQLAAVQGPLRQYLSWLWEYRILPMWTMQDVDLGGTDLRGAGLNAADLCGANLTNVDLRNADLVGTKMRSAVLERADLRYACLNNADLRRADLSRANLSYAILNGADLRGADLTGAILTGVTGWATVALDAEVRGLDAAINVPTPWRL